MAWNPGQSDAPPDFLAERYEGASKILRISTKKTPPAPPFSPHPSPERSSARRSRSRSPLQPVSRIVIYDDAGNQLAEHAEEEERVSNPHALYERSDESAERSDESAESLGVERGSRGSVRGRGRGRGRGGHVGSRGQGRGRAGGLRRGDWQPGRPLEEIWVTDDDAPRELREMARDVVRRRQERVEALDARRRSARARALASVNEELVSASADGDVFYDAIDGMEPLLEGVDLHFEWSVDEEWRVNVDTFESVEETFVLENVGSVSSYINPYDAFRSYWDDDILQEIVNETNRYASRIRSAVFQAAWHPMNVHELLCLFAFWMMTGIIRMPTICSYFSSNSLLKTDVFSRITTLKRYTYLNRALHFVDTSDTDSTDPNPTNNAASSDPVHRLRPIILYNIKSPC